MTLYLLAFAIFAVAALAQSVTGFGFALVSIPLLAALTSPEVALPAAAVIGLPMTAGVLIAERAHVSWRPVFQLVGPALLGMPLGLLVLKLLPDSVLTGVIALVVLGCTALVWRGWQFTPTVATVSAAGMLSGVLSTSTGTNGPALVTTLQAMGFQPRPFRATIAAVFAINGLITLGAFALTDVLTAEAGLLAAIGLPAIALGGWFGNRMFARSSAARFRKLLLAGLVASSAVALARAGAYLW